MQRSNSERGRGNEKGRYTGSRRAAAGATLDHVVKVTLFLHDLEYRAPFHEVWTAYFPNDPPARIAVRVADADAGPGGNSHFALDVVALAS